VKLRQLEPPVPIGHPHHDDVDPHTFEPVDAVHPRAFDRRPAFHHHAEGREKTDSGPEAAGALPGALQLQEKEMIEAALARTRGKVAGPNGAAASLGVPASTLESKIKQLGIEKGRFTNV
jgi:DNA-binding NtrC family response regulator